MGVKDKNKIGQLEFCLFFTFLLIEIFFCLFLQFSKYSMS